ncbi:MAG: symmetrical bis(5'-nucleosyl)-tetraphosphatase [Myxococcota bacterium]
MATYVIGDVHGCYNSLRALLRQLHFRADRDSLWFAGDLINRGPASLDVLRFVYDLGPHARMVLGNHELYVLASYFGVAQPNTLMAKVLTAHDANRLINWLRSQPLLLQQDRWLMVHAGILPCLQPQQVCQLAQQAQRTIQSDRCRTVLQLWKHTQQPYNQQLTWCPSLLSPVRDYVLLNMFTRMRFCTTPWQMDFSCTTHPHEAPTPLRPWFAYPRMQQWRRYTVLFGHWAALGLHQSRACIGLDTGCSWGRQLTAFCLDTGRFYQQKCVDELPTNTV